MRLNPKYSYEFNLVLNEELNDAQQIKNFASLLSDKDRFLAILPLIEKNSELIEEKLGYKLKDEIDFFVVRAEKFKSFSEPITIEYSILPEEMILFLIKEIVKVSITDRFFTEVERQQYLNSFVEYITVSGDFDKYDFVKFGSNLHNHSKELYSSYEFKDIDFSKKTMKDYIEEMYKKQEEGSR